MNGDCSQNRMRIIKRKNKGDENVRGMYLAYFYSAPGGARFLQVKVLNPPGSGKDIAESKGVHREMESEGSWIWGIY